MSFESEPRTFVTFRAIVKHVQLKCSASWRIQASRVVSTRSQDGRFKMQTIGFAFCIERHLYRL